MDPIIEVAGMAVNRFEFFSFFKIRSWIIILISMFQQEGYVENGESILKCFRVIISKPSSGDIC